MLRLNSVVPRNLNIFLQAELELVAERQQTRHLQQQLEEAKAGVAARAAEVQSLAQSFEQSTLDLIVANEAALRERLRCEQLEKNVLDLQSKVN